MPYTDYSLQINLVWGKLLSWAQGGGIWGLLVSPITSVAGWIVALIIYMMTIFLGVIRIWLITVMIIGFPISLALKQIPFARKLSSMVEDTLYGLILASLMSSIAIGVAAYVLADSPGGPIWSATIFAGTGINGISNWVAAAALFTAVLIPTVFAPLTGTLFQTASQAAMVGVGVGGFDGGGGGSPHCWCCWVGSCGSGRGSARWAREGYVGRSERGASDDRAAGSRHHAEHGARREASLRGASFAEERRGRRDYGDSDSDGRIRGCEIDSNRGTLEQLVDCLSGNWKNQRREARGCAGIRDINAHCRMQIRALGAFVFNAVTAPPPSVDVLNAQAPSLTQWHAQQTQMSPPQFLSQSETKPHHYAPAVSSTCQESCRAS